MSVILDVQSFTGAGLYSSGSLHAQC